MGDSPNSSTPSNPSNSPNSPNPSTPSNSPQQAITSFTKSTLQPVIVLPNSTEEVLSLNALSSNRGITIRRLNILLSPLMGQDTVLENTFNQVQLVSGGNVIATKNISSSDDYQEVLNYSIVSFGNLAIDVEEDSQKSIEIHISTNETLTDALLKDWNIVIGQDDIYSLDDSNNSYYNTNPITSSFSVRRTLSGPTPPPTVRNFRATQALINSLTLEWNEFKDAVSYELDYCMGSSCTNYTNLSTVTTETKTLSSLQVGTIYRFRIRAKKANNIYSGYKVLTQATLLSTPSLTLGAETKTSIQLSWNAIANADGYMIEHCIHTLKDTECTDFANPKTIDNGSATSTTITDLQPSSRYQFRIKATGRYPKAGSVYSTPVSAVTDLLPPTNIRVINVSNSTIDLEWDAVPMGDGYIISPSYCDQSCNDLDAIEINDPLITSVQLKSLIPNYIHLIYIETINNSKNSNVAGDPIDARTTLNIPFNFEITAATSTSITLEWGDVSGADGYALQYCKGETCTDSDYIDLYTGLSIYRHLGLTTSETYKYRVQAIGTFPEIDSDWSRELVSAVRPPTNFRAISQTATTITLAWDSVASSRATGYVIQYCEGDNCIPDTNYAVSGSTTTSATIVSLNSNTEYVLKIKTVHSNSNLNNDQAYLSTISTRTRMNIPSNLRTISSTGNSITLLWNTVNNAEGYVIRYCAGVGCIPDRTVAIPGGSTSSYTVTRLEKLTIYNFQIQTLVFSPLLNSEYSGLIDESTTLPAPENLKLVTTDDIGVDIPRKPTSLTVKWDIVTDASGYKIQYCDGGYCREMSVAGMDTNELDITGLSSNTEYTIKIKSLHLFSSPYSSAISARTSLANPENFIATSQLDTSIEIEWDAVVGADEYELWYCDLLCFDQPDPLSISSGTTTYSATGLTPNTMYLFLLRAVTNSPDEFSSPYADVIANTTLAIPENLRVTDSTDTTLALAWDEVAGSNGYSIKSCDGSGCTPSRINTIYGGLSATTYTLVSLTPNTVYRFIIRSRGNYGDTINSPYSNAASQSTTLATPSNLRATAQTDTSISLAWDAVTSANGYTIRYCNGTACTPDEISTIASGSTTVHTTSNFTPNTTYVFQIKSTHTNASLNSPYSSIISTRTKLSIPSNFRTTAQTSTSISLSWSAVTGADGYEIRGCSGASCTPSLVYNAVYTVYQLTGLTADTVYRYEIKAKGTAPEIDSAYSTIVSVTTNS